MKELNLNYLKYHRDRDKDGRQQSKSVIPCCHYRVTWLKDGDREKLASPVTVQNDKFASGVKY